MSKCVLVIDDSQDIRDLFTVTLSYIGYEVDTVESGEKGIESIKARNYDLIFLDLQMPGQNGVETLRELRKIDDDVPIYIVTGFYDKFSEQLKSIGKEGIKYEFLRKPIRSSQLMTITKGLLEEPLPY